MTRRLFVSLLAFTVSCASHRALPDAPETASAKPGQFRIELERGGCFGTCPIYKLSLAANGTVTWNGEGFVGTKGVQRASVSPAQVEELARHLQEAGFFALTWEVPCPISSTDAPTVQITFVHDGKRRTLSDYQGDTCVPKTVRELEDEIDRVAGSARWSECNSGACEP